MKVNADSLYAHLGSLCAQHNATTIRVFENGRSYEDFSVSKTLSYSDCLKKQIDISKLKYPPSSLIPNFTIGNIDSNIVIKKKSKHATRGIVFDSNSEIEFEYHLLAKKRFIYMNVLNTVTYTDGLHRYNDKKPKRGNKKNES
jgi:hypothetical protein